MTQKELHNQRLVKEAQKAVMQQHTRRHFIKESAMGFGALALGSLLGGCNTSSSANLFDATNPLAPKAPPFLGKAKSVIYLHMAVLPLNLKCLVISQSLQNWTDWIVHLPYSMVKNLRSLEVFLRC